MPDIRSQHETAATPLQAGAGVTAAPKKRRKHRNRFIHTWFFRVVLGPLCYGFYKICQCTCASLPPAMVYAIGRLLAIAAWYLLPRRRGIAIRNLEIAFGDQYTARERRRLARQSFQHFLLTTMDVLMLPAIFKKGRWGDYVTMTPEEEAFVQSLAAHDGPVAFHTAHMGSWEMSSGLAKWCGSTCGVVYRPLDIPQIDADVRRLRAAAGVTLYPKKGALRGYVRTLKNNQWLGVIADQNAGSKGAFLDFFGVAASTQVSYFPLYKRFNPRIVAVFMLRDGFKPRFRYSKFYTTTCNTDTDDESEAMRLGQWYMDALMDTIRGCPEQYCWVHKRWSSRPPGAPKLYQNLGQPLAPDVLARQPAAPIPSPKWRD